MMEELYMLQIIQGLFLDVQSKLQLNPVKNKQLVQLRLYTKNLNKRMKFSLTSEIHN